jgi:hypothetical protein
MPHVQAAHQTASTVRFSALACPAAAAVSMVMVWLAASKELQFDELKAVSPGKFV